MEHEVFVPVPAERLRAALADPAQVARAVPGLQQDAGAQPVTGRLKLRVAGHTITYRGTARITARADGAYVVEGDATEARGAGSVKLALTLRPTETDGGTTLRFEGTASADGRIAELPSDAVGAAVVRLLSRFAEELGAEASDPEPASGAEPESEPVSGAEPESEPVSGAEPESEPVSGAEPEPEPVSGAEPDPEPVSGAEPDPEPGFDADVAEVSPEALEDFTVPVEPPAEAAHARRTMIGRSAEEVDHAPPRGRYAPVPAPQTVVPGNTLRWAAPAAALVVASAIVVGRALRRRG
ncbi:SRPBCC family protein [Streptomyces sp. NBC_01275]|uniref:SRPBCC family protein n=1 Tax=Streptomyces sp. NBC_01275 TaxID=2903807 RepID=UPI002255A277|nr:SRPBCC family protein [Streptomyces sp. NBC_01275]MCX4763732.1 SRPBCC family protein [Streptomyces sp. NBC_01275]